MTWEELKLLQEAGMSVQSHGLHHQPLTELNLDVLRDELRLSKELLEQHLGSAVNYFAIPGGFVDERVYTEILNAGYRAICNSEPGLASNGEVIARVPVMHSTSLVAFSDLANRKLTSLRRMSAQRRLAKAAKSLLGLRRYEALKHIKLRLLEMTKRRVLLISLLVPSCPRHRRAASAQSGKVPARLRL